MCLPPLALVGLPITLSVWMMVRRDRQMMSAGLMDPRGHGHARAALNQATLGMGFNLTGLSYGLLVVLSRLAG